MRLRFFAKQRLGLKRAITPEGFLVCQDVPVARTGEMYYAEGELVDEKTGKAVVTAKNGVVVITREEKELFNEVTLSSCIAKPVTIGHPMDWVNPDNYKDLAKGTMVNVRRGEGGDNDLLMADLLITDREAIDKVLKEKIEEVSLGYDADYEEVEPGRGLQRNIIVNHIALVEHGRCGSRCAIGDQKTMSWLDKLKAALKTKDQKSIDEAMEEAEKEAKSKDEETEEEKAAREKAEKEAKEAEEKKTKDNEEAEKAKTNDSLAKALVGVTDTLKSIGSRLDALEGKGSTRTTDAMTLDDGQWADFVSKVEIISPGTSFDRATIKTKDAMCQCQRQVLQNAMAKDASNVKPFLQGQELGKMTGDQLAMAFTAVAEVIRTKNNMSGIRTGISTKDFGRKPPTPADINKMAAEHWKNH